MTPAPAVNNIWHDAAQVVTLRSADHIVPRSSLRSTLTACTLVSTASAHVAWRSKPSLRPSPYSEAELARVGGIDRELDAVTEASGHRHHRAVLDRGAQREIELAGGERERGRPPERTIGGGIGVDPLLDEVDGRRRRHPSVDMGRLFARRPIEGDPGCGGRCRVGAITVGRREHDAQPETEGDDGGWAHGFGGQQRPCPARLERISRGSHPAHSVFRRSLSKRSRVSKVDGCPQVPETARATRPLNVVRTLLFARLVCDVELTKIRKVYEGQTRPVIPELDLTIPAAQDGRARRAERLRQVDDAAHGRRARGADRRQDHASTAATSRSVAAGRARHRDGVPELRALPAHERVREHGVRAAHRARARRGDPAARRRRSPRASASRATSSAGPRRCRAASASASRSAARSCASPKVFLFDEPLSNLDAKLRGEMRREIARIHAARARRRCTSRTIRSRR